MVKQSFFFLVFFVSVLYLLYVNEWKKNEETDDFFVPIFYFISTLQWQRGILLLFKEGKAYAYFFILVTKESILRVVLQVFNILLPPYKMPYV